MYSVLKQIGRDTGMTSFVGSVVYTKLKGPNCLNSADASGFTDVLSLCFEFNTQNLNRIWFEWHPYAR